MTTLRPNANPSAANGATLWLGYKPEDNVFVEIIWLFGQGLLQVKIVTGSVRAKEMLSVVVHGG